MNWSKEQLEAYAERYIKTEEQDVLKTDCDMILFLLEHCQISVSGKTFFAQVNCAGISNQIVGKRAQPYKQSMKNSPYSAGEETLAYTGLYDFGHTSAQWDNVIHLGIAGLRNKIAQYAEKEDETKQRFYHQLLRVYDGALLFLKRVAKTAEQAGKTEMAEGLRHLTKNPPANLFQAMQTSILYYQLQHIFEGTPLRTLGRLDSLFYPFFIKETKEEAEKLIFDYLKEIDQLQAPSNIPFALGGTDLKGNSLINELSFLLLHAYGTAKTTNTKLHLLCSDHMPWEITEQALRFVRAGNNSIVFMSDKTIIKALLNLGESVEEATEYHVVGCYECGGRSELTCSCNARVNIPKALELALNNGRDMLTGQLIGLEHHLIFQSYEQLYKEFERQLTYLCQCAMKITDFYESHYSQLHSAPFLSGTYSSALEKGEDLYCGGGARYSNSSVNALGLATAVDSLEAIRKAVFEEHILTMEEMTDILKSDWEHKEPLRLLIKNKFPKFGQGNRQTDAIAQKIVALLSNTINKTPNAKGGQYRLGLFSIDWRWFFGKNTAASADGRKSGETISQNTSAVFGADKNGATAHLLSVASIDASQVPNGAIADIDLHASAVQGENGIQTLLSTLKTYFELGGFAVHYNVLDTEVLQRAKKEPEKYPNLQVRLCGWNVLFSTLSEKEKDEFIARSMK